MGETPDDIKQEIEQARARLGANLNQLEHTVKKTLDWRSHFDRKPAAFIGAAFGAAFLIGCFVTQPDPPHGKVSIEATRPPVRRNMFHCAFSTAYCAS